MAPIPKPKKEVSQEEYQQIMGEIEKEVEPKVGTRDFYKAYSSVVKRHGIDLDDYLIKFGDAHYNSFMDHMQEFTHNGQDFVNGVGEGLQRALIDKSKITREVLEDSEAFKKFAFDSHVDIYVDNGLEDILLESPVQNTRALLHCYLWPVIMTEKYNSARNAADVAKKIISNDVEYLENKVIDKMNDLVEKLEADKAIDKYIRAQLDMMGLEYGDLYPGHQEARDQHHRDIQELNQKLNPKPERDRDEDTVEERIKEIDMQKFMKEMLMMENMYFEGIDQLGKEKTITKEDAKQEIKDQQEVTDEDSRLISRIYNRVIDFKNRVVNYRNTDESSQKSSSVDRRSSKSGNIYILDEMNEYVRVKDYMGSAYDSPKNKKEKSVEQTRTSTHKFLFDHKFINQDGDLESYGHSSSSSSSSFHGRSATTPQERSQEVVSAKSVSVRNDSPCNKTERSEDSWRSPSKGISNFYRVLI